MAPTTHSLAIMDEIVRQLRAAGCVFAEEEAGLLRRAASTDEELTAMTGRRVAGEPLEYVVGWAPFLGLDIRVLPGVFIPRRRTEFLATEAIRRCDPGAVVLDMCCGSGAIGAAIAAKVPVGELHATDVDPVATACARQNVPGTVYTGDLFASLPASLRGRVDVLVVNPPYVPSAQVPLLPAEARDHEPLTTLDGGTDGLGVLRRVLADAGKWLTPGGCLLAETSARQTGSALESIASAGLDGEVLTDPDLEATLITGRSRLGDNTAELPHNRGIWGVGRHIPRPSPKTGGAVAKHHSRPSAMYRYEHYDPFTG
jgi:release factor glutamine methyltransferase